MGGCRKNKKMELQNKVRVVRLKHQIKVMALVLLGVIMGVSFMIAYQTFNELGDFILR